MKRAGQLFDQITDIDNLRLAYIKAKRGKEAKPDVYEYSVNQGKNLINLQNQLISEKFDIGNYHFFTIFEPKQRLICAAPFNERVLHHAIINICHAYFEKFQIEHSYATRINKGQYAALDNAAYNQSKYRWFCKLDIRKYFDSIDHAILYELLCRRFKDQKLLNLFKQIIQSYQTSPCKGLPIGNLTSQYFANFYLAHADHYILEKLKIPAYIRYMDDMVLWHSNKEELIEKRNKFVSFINQNLQLEVKPECQNSADKGLPLLGYVLFDDKIRLNKNSKKRFVLKSKSYLNLLNNGVWDQHDYAKHIVPLVAFTQYAESYYFRKSFFSKSETNQGALTA